MSNEEIKEIIKSKVYGMTNAEIAQAYGITEAKAAEIIAENTAELAEERRYRDMLEGGADE